ncbi:hypothetical protein PMIN01_12618 [Paraphaeosphaeria minitans]|uniref:FAD-binding domain-containing protein n=1 Tax=Paraphaeosphaeria minitans TaxID=565426 RepID=A0A9P6G8N7_9PLEO|nr:hypothetical protein PMIN01_12618 [Paraphaeosphaeria minitans]
MREEGSNMYSIEGKLQRSIPLASKTECDADRMVYHRRDIHDTLKEYATRVNGFGEPAEILTSSCVLVCDLDAGIVTLKDGSMIEGDVIIGADGAEVEAGHSWTSKGDLETLLEEYKDFPAWATGPFRLAKDDIGLRKLRNTKPLEMWHRGRVIFIGDAAHAMLPTQG